MDNLASYHAKSGKMEPVFTIEIQTLPSEVDVILDAVMAVHPLRYGNYARNASVSGVGYETAKPLPGSTTDTHAAGFSVGDVETYPMVELKISIPQQVTVLEHVMDAIMQVHHYEEPVIFVRQAWASRANYDPSNDNPNRWWNNGRGLPGRITN